MEGKEKAHGINKDVITKINNKDILELYIFIGIEKNAFMT
jgi:hypothetical protein